MRETDAGDMDHVVTVEATQLYRADVTPEMADYLTGDGVYRNIYGEGHDRAGVELQFAEELKRTFECSCGRRFRKPETARLHLEEHRNDRNDDTDA